MLFKNTFYKEDHTSQKHQNKIKEKIFHKRVKSNHYETVKN